MFGLIKKDLFRSILDVLIVIPLLAAYWLLTTDTLSILMIMMMGGLTYILMIGSVFINEQDEDKHHGYAFIQTLPLSNRDIVTAKFALPVIIGLVVTGCFYLLSLLFDGSALWQDLSGVFIITNGMISLIMVAVIYIGIYRFGYIKFLRYFLAFGVVLGIIPQIVLIQFKDMVNVSMIEQAIAAVAAIPPLMIVVCGLVLYAGLMQMAITMKSNHEND